MQVCFYLGHIKDDGKKKKIQIRYVKIIFTGSNESPQVNLTVFQYQLCMYHFWCKFLDSHSHHCWLLFLGPHNLSS
jgi:hypothetical protein